MRDGAPIYIQARLRFKATDPASGEPDALAVCRSDLADSGLHPRCYDHSLTIKGDMETVLAALHRCRTRLYQAEICNTRPLGEGRERAPFFETVRADPPMLAGR